MLVILSAYLTLFKQLNGPSFPIAFLFVVFFVLTNIGITLLPDTRFGSARGQLAIRVIDVVCVTGTLFFLRIDDAYLFVGFATIFLVASIWAELRVFVFSLLVVSVLFGIFNYLRFSRSGGIVNVEQFLTLSLFFVVAMFYVFMSRRLLQDSRLSRIILESKRNAEIMVEITRALSSSLKTEDVLRVIVQRLSEVVSALDCSIMRTDPRSGEAYLMVRSSDPNAKDTPVDLKAHPELHEAYILRRMVLRDAGERSVVAVPMIAQDAVLGLIHVVGRNSGEPASEETMRFFEVIASTAANALKNAALFEEVEHRARTDFLTGLPNHRHFQATLTAEIGRAQRHSHPLSLLIIDLDHLKLVNDHYGHPAGDMVIRATAETIRLSCRDFDFAARYGGEEFMVILPETPLAGAVQVAERMREHIAQVDFPTIGNISASIGVSNYPINSLTKDDLVRVADQALYVAKNGGRNRVAYFNYQLILH